MALLDQLTSKKLLEYVEEGYKWSYGICYIVLMLIFFGLHPFYVYVNKVNRVRDESIILLNFRNYCVPAFCTSCITCFALYIIVQVFHLLISLLAVQRLVIYFVPSMEKQTIWVQNKLYGNIWYIYIAFGLKEIIGIVCLFVCEVAACSPSKQMTFRIFYMSTFFFLNAFLVTSALLYIPITLSIWKLTSLTMNQDKPQKYIFFQTVVILIFKAACVPALIAFIFCDYSINVSIVFVASMDIIIIPLIIQISYLGCNKRNINTLFHSFNLKRFAKVLFDFKVETTVDPQINLTHFRSPRHSDSQ
ncbi:hypothetical protein CRE_18373 [Caenorhabditis remanei]|uniref:Serpentine Receptor, class Z n=1 Tax=Caenorhabditis remanei TaxID=31234 RepID=E3NUF8_CAERE|nr:hypothetical protein CRE_18373 [Caenorhabditis remanei]